MIHEFRWFVKGFLLFFCGKSEEWEDKLMFAVKGKSARCRGKRNSGALYA